MTQTAQHTAAPWRISRHGTGRVIVDDCGNKIAEVATARHLADFVRPTDNAAFIVRACNAHDDLVAVKVAAASYLKALDQWENTDKAERRVAAAEAVLRATVAKAGAV